LWGLVDIRIERTSALSENLYMCMERAAGGA